MRKAWCQIPTGLKTWLGGWRKTEKKALRIIQLIKEIQRSPFAGTGKPEPLKHELSGCWSRRMDREHRLVYQVKEETIRILAGRYHS